MNPHTASFLQLVKNRFRFHLFLFYKLPAAYFSGVRVREINEEKCVTSVPYKWLSQNPFRSTYFACLAMAAEMSTGVLAMATVYKSNPPVSLLVVNLEASFSKKATERTFFTCEQGRDFEQAVARAINTGEAQTVKTTSVGKNKNGEEIAKFFITWSFKVKTKK
ncbi:MAG: DUF4442 domain-containing protein [Chitinophagaceae bacterium]|nr:DUF4442 domain-containing protein [Chitinophagaceae bacterium]HQU56314.1 DUF4442 domain-containing protein [Chitinophagaceae bacterium]HQV06735.1 DUF4442 domain-containing protein [Chitinophagaceae bacterium]